MAVDKITYEIQYLQFKHRGARGSHFKLGAAIGSGM